MVSWPCAANDLVESCARSGGVSSVGRLPHVLFGGDERSQLVGDRCVPCEKLLAIDRLAAIDPLEVFAERRFNPRVCGSARFD